MASRVAVAQRSASLTSQQQNARFPLALKPTTHKETSDSGLAPSRFDFGRLCLFPLLPIQTKLSVGAANDPLEREADQVADRIARMPDPGALSFSPSGEVVHRTCASCADQEESDTVRRKYRSCSDQEGTGDKLSRKAIGRAPVADGVAAPVIVHEVIRSSGQPLNRATRAFLEPRFGYDFSKIRIHNDPRAAASAIALNALAYTVGNNIVFGAGQFAPETVKGLTLLAHELTHAVQQSRGPGVARLPADRVQRQKAGAGAAPTMKVDPAATCNVDQRRKLDPAALTADDWLSRTTTALRAWLNGDKTKDAQAAAAALTKHFHTSDERLATYVLDRLKTIHSDMFRRQNLRVNCPPASDPVCGPRSGTDEYIAAVPDANPNEIDLCAPFFERKLEDRASTLIHELGHAQLGLNALQRIDDRAYQWDEYYFYLTTGQALTNAESYAMFAREVATGFSPAKGGISTGLRDCPDEWTPFIADAITTARMWNHQAALHTKPPHPFSTAYKVLDQQLKSRYVFKCITDGGGRCSNATVAYWYAMGDLRICPSFLALPTPRERGLNLLAALYGLESVVGGQDKRNRAAREAQRLHESNVPSVADVMSWRLP